MRDGHVMKWMKDPLAGFISRCGARMGKFTALLVTIAMLAGTTGAGATAFADETVTDGGNVTSVPISITRADMWSAFDKGQTATYEASFTNVKETVAVLPLSGASEGRTWLVVAGVTALVLLLAGIVGLALIGRGRP